jgi:hypothetical protein
LAAGKRQAVGADGRIVALGERGDEVVDAGGAGGAVEEVVGGGLGGAEEDVGADRGGEEGGFLGNEGEGVAVLMERDGGDVGVLVEDGAVLGSVESGAVSRSGVERKGSDRSRREMMLVFPQPVRVRKRLDVGVEVLPDGPTMAANWPFSI